MKSKDKKETELIRYDIISNLPEFLSLIVLFLGSGTNLEDSLEKIIDSYSEMGDSKSAFKKELIALREKKKITGESLVSLFYSYAKSSHIKELNRISSIMMENRLRGTDLWEKLKSQGDDLWEEKKRITIEKIKLLDSKLAFPLSLTLIALILIASAPALLEIS